MNHSASGTASWKDCAPGRAAVRTTRTKPSAPIPARRSHRAATSAALTSTSRSGSTSSRKSFCAPCPLMRVRPASGARAAASVVSVTVASLGEVAAPAALPARQSRACRVTRMDDDVELHLPAISTPMGVPMSRSTVSRNRLMIKRVSSPAGTGSDLRHLRLRLVRYSLYTHFINTSPAHVSSVAATDTRWAGFLFPIPYSIMSFSHREDQGQPGPTQWRGRPGPACQWCSVRVLSQWG